MFIYDAYTHTHTPKIAVQIILNKNTHNEREEFRSEFSYILYLGLVKITKKRKKFPSFFGHYMHRET